MYIQGGFFMSFFVTLTDEGYSLTTGGYIAAAILLTLLLLAAVIASGKKEHKQMNARQLAFCAMCIALACITSMMKLYEFPFGGSITFFSMLFICLPGFFYGPATGIFTASAYGILQFLLGPYIFFPIQIIVDYLLAFGAIGVSGFFFKSKHGLIKGYIAGIIGRYIFAVISGWIFFGEYAWEGWAPLPYSLTYNGIYIFSEAALTIIILLIPAVSKALSRIKEAAVS